MPSIGLFEITNTVATMRIRAMCLTCARNLAAENAGNEGRTIWRDPAQSTIRVIGPAEGRPAILERKEHGRPCTDGT